MGIQDIIKAKKEWRAHIARIKTLPKDYQTVYKEMEKYIYKVGLVDLGEGIGLLYGVVDLFEEGAALGKDVLEITGDDVATFCDDLIKDSKTYFDDYQEIVDEKVSKAIRKAIDKAK